MRATQHSRLLILLPPTAACAVRRGGVDWPVPRASADSRAWPHAIEPSRLRRSADLCALLVWVTSSPENKNAPLASHGDRRYQSAQINTQVSLGVLNITQSAVINVTIFSALARLARLTRLARLARLAVCELHETLSSCPRV